MRKLIEKIPGRLRFIVLVYFLSMLIFSILRLLLFLLNYDGISIPLLIRLKAFYLGLGFDTVVAGYILILPLVIYFITSVLKKNSRVLDKSVFSYILLLFSIAFFICCADIPWYAHEQTRLSMAAMQWTDSPSIMLGIMFGDSSHYPYLLAFALLVSGFFIGMKKIRMITLPGDKPISQSISIPVYILAILILLVGIRGRIGIKSPIRWGTAFFSEYNLTNQLGLNPVYTLLQSYLEMKNNSGKQGQWMKDNDALALIKENYGTLNSNDYSPVARQVQFNTLPHRYNIMLVIMESMTAHHMAAFGNRSHLTPVLDSLLSHSVSFTNFYSDGIHTNCGVYSSLFGFPSLPSVHHMKDLSNQQKYQGLGTTLSKNNYNTFFFTTHDDQFDNMGGFLFPNGFRHIISQKYYPDKEVVGPLGIPDHVLFRKVIENIDGLNAGLPFCAAVLTSSNHGPYVIPADIPFTPHSRDIKDQAVEYSDWSIGKFLSDCKNESWYDSTIFIFTGDHGAIVDNMDRYVTYHHVPLILFAPSMLNPSVQNGVGGQVDIYATVMGLLQIPYINNSFGIDLLREQRSYITFTYDDEPGAFAKDQYLVIQHGKPKLFNLDNGRESLNKSLRDSMEAYTKSVMQTTQWMIKNRKMY